MPRLPKLPEKSKLWILLPLFGFFFMRSNQTLTTVQRDASTKSSLRRADRSLRNKNGKWEIFQPFFDMPEVTSKPILLGNPHAYIQNIQERLDWLDTITYTDRPKDNATNLERAQAIYLRIIKEHLSASVYGDYEKSVVGRTQEARAYVAPLNKQQRAVGLDWTYLGDTMVGHARLNNIQALLKNVMAQNVAGDYIETGVWRGGASMFARSVMAAYGEEKKRKSFVCDSFRGLPPGERGFHERDSGWDKTSYLEVNEEIVASGFQKYSLLDENVIFAKGFFNETMPHLAPRVDKLAVMRLDGDLYESTVDVLYHLYGKLSVGGYVIMDDWYGFPSKDACDDFFDVHNIAPKIIQIDDLSAYWQKTEEVDVQFWRFEQKQFKDKSKTKDAAMHES